MMNSVIQHYQDLLASHGYKADEAQMKAVNRLQHLADEWLAFKLMTPTPSTKTSWFKKVLGDRLGKSDNSSPYSKAPKGVYLWGGVGRGKSFIMDSFFDSLKTPKKIRVHFHEFMRGVHQQMQVVKGMADPLDEVAKRIAAQYEIICFDEFHVSDVADAMILYKLLFKLFENGSNFVMTSNFEPSTLYPDGLHRDRIMPAIELIKQKMDILNVDAGIDYRRRDLTQVQVYYYPLNEDTTSKMSDLFEQWRQAKDEHNVLTIENRPVYPLKVAGNMVWFDFNEICDGPRSQNDYLALIARFDTVFVSNVPKLSPTQNSQARRFTWLVDVFYDHKIKLVLSAEVDPDAIYTKGIASGEFHRTVSRLVEMQSQEYLEQEQRQAVNLIS